MTVTVVLETLPAVAGDGLTTPGNYKLQRIYIFTTRQGLLYTALLFVMLLGAINYTNSLAYVLTFLLGSLLLVCMLHTYRNMRSLIISTPAPKPVYAGEDIRLPLLFENRTALLRIAIHIEHYPDKKNKRNLKLQTKQATVNLQPNQARLGHLLIHTTHRGVIRPGEFKVSSRYPLGLLVSWSYLDSDQECIVYPAPVGSRILPHQDDLYSEEQAGASTGTDDFTGFRPYQHGDSIRNIDWKSFAREIPLQVKRFSGGGAGKLLFTWDQCRHLGNDEQRLSQLCLWVREAERNGYLYGLEIPGTSIDLGCGDNHMHGCLTALARYGFRDA